VVDDACDIALDPPIQLSGSSWKRLCRRIWSCVSKPSARLAALAKGSECWSMAFCYECPWSRFQTDFVVNDPCLNHRVLKIKSVNWELTLDNWVRTGQLHGWNGEGIEDFCLLAVANLFSWEVAGVVSVAGVTWVQEVHQALVTLQVVMTGALGIHQGIKSEFA